MQTGHNKAAHITAEQARPLSPWPGSSHECRLRWQLDAAGTLPNAVDAVRAIAAELRAAHLAGWSLVEPVRNGHLLAARSSRRRRARMGAEEPVEPVAQAAGVLPCPSTAKRRRLRLVDEPALAGDDVLSLVDERARQTPVLKVIDNSWVQRSGPELDPALLAEVVAQVPVAEAIGHRWGVAFALVGPGLDLVADGSALRLHGFRSGALVRTWEVLAFHHIADGAGDLPAAAAAYDVLAAAIDRMGAAGGRWAGADDGFVHIAFSRS